MGYSLKYFPYFRGKQYELITIRECSDIFKNSNFVPIIEPVKEQLSGLSKTIDTVVDASGQLIVISNPEVGDFSHNNSELLKFLEEKHTENKTIIVGIILNESTSLESAIEMCRNFEGRQISLIHSGFSKARDLAVFIQENNFQINFSIFESEKAGKLYQKHFKFNDHQILLKDSFEKRNRNADHPDTPEIFSDLHVTYTDENMTGFSDFLMVGNDYQVGGGPAYTIAIHLTFINDEDENIMYISHFKSDRQDTPTDPAGKFLEALNKLIDHLNSPENKFYETSAILELKELHTKEHYPGLGYLKKLSMKHHIETFAQFFEEQG